MSVFSYVLAGIISFGSVFLKGFQHKNIAGNHYKLVFVTSYLMAVFDVLIIGAIAKAGWSMAIPCGTGAALGMVTSMKLHDKLFNHKEVR